MNLHTTTPGSYFATCPQFVEDLLARELQALGAEKIKTGLSGVSFTGPLETLYRACLYSRIANRILLPLAQFTADAKEEIYNRVVSLPWEEHFANHSTFAVDCTIKGGFIHNSNYAGLVVKDAVADRFRQKTGIRPAVKTEQPGTLIHLHIHKNEATVYLDLSGESLHRRGYRVSGSPASLKENAAAALLYRAGWPELAEAGYAFMDLMCGSGTLLIEAALMAANIPPRSRRTYYGFLQWKKHDAGLWKRLTEQAAAGVNFNRLTPVVGYDADKRAVSAAQANAEAAGLSGKIHIERRDIGQADHPAQERYKSGLVVINPPYGIRLGETGELRGLYKQIGEVLIGRFAGWKAAIISADRELSFALGLRAVKTNSLYNGSIRCLLTHFELDPGQVLGSHKQATETDISADDMLANRLKKNWKHLGRWARRSNITCYRLYDADLPEYAAAIDFYENRWLQVQEYAPPAEIDPVKAEQRLRHLVRICRIILELEAPDIYVKQRRVQKGVNQYQKLGSSSVFRIVQEGGLRFKVNLSDYLDTGLFLDNRLLRGHIRTLAAGRDFLNLFSYTGTATVYAAAGGARSTTSVDANTHYHQWAEENLNLNGCGGKRHEFIKADCLEWLKSSHRRYDLIYLDPPTFSNTKKKGLLFDLQKQHTDIIQLCMKMLTEAGILIFAVNSRKFKLDTESLSCYLVKDLSRSTLPEDFRRRPGMHKCWQIERGELCYRQE